jgi:hypothetical protein
VGEGVSQRGRGARPEEPTAPEGTQTVLAEEVGGGEDVFLVGAEQEDEQGLRKAGRDRRDASLRGDEPPDGEAFGPPMRTFQTVSRRSAQNLSSTHFGE